jgi:hypothetical protein
MRSAQSRRARSAFVPGLCRGARVRSRGLSIGDDTRSLCLRIRDEACPYWVLVFGAGATAASVALKRPQVGEA